MKIHKCTCGSFKCELSQSLDSSKGYPKSLFYIRCLECGKKTGLYNSSSKAITTWNDLVKDNER